jgi:hypothetical protein
MTTIQRPECIQFNHWIFDQITCNVRTHKVQDDYEVQITTFDLLFSYADGSGVVFPCDSAGNVFFDELPEIAQSNYLDAVLNQHCYAKIECQPRVVVYQNCACGSGEEPERIYDARGIYLCQCCDKCKDKALSRYRSDVLTNPCYWADEAIEAE